MKDEIEIENLIRYEEVEKEVIKYINYYNKPTHIKVFIILNN